MTFVAEDDLEARLSTRRESLLASVPSTFWSATLMWGIVTALRWVILIIGNVVAYGWQSNASAYQNVLSAPYRFDAAWFADISQFGYSLSPDPPPGFLCRCLALSGG